MAHIHSSSSLYMSILSEIQLHESRSTSSPHLPDLQHFFLTTDTCSLQKDIRRSSQIFFK